MMERVARRARLAPTGLINNTNLGGETTPETLLLGQRVLEETAQRSGVPLLAASASAGVLSGARGLSCPAFPITRLMKPEWMEI